MIKVKRNDIEEDKVNERKKHWNKRMRKKDEWISKMNDWNMKRIKKRSLMNIFQWLIHSESIKYKMSNNEETTKRRFKISKMKKGKSIK